MNSSNGGAANPSELHCARVQVLAAASVRPPPLQQLSQPSPTQRPTCLQFLVNQQVRAALPHAERPCRQAAPGQGGLKPAGELEGWQPSGASTMHEPVDSGHSGSKPKVVAGAASAGEGCTHTAALPGRPGAPHSAEQELFDPRPAL